ncbi:major facilitator superfamily domain-containing protein [Xylaria bambusicola]|uniref:major facilitator superfamily domain-containing protein n=1 Tax=Xylaria bambusicola TaxID=326684 RepID=UPI0020081C5A|nr:major facilitator superfamily domain-containing protein [Xylaria bambusicola]KAI0506506.1 major facilitator superfamily domain-containing protein [Xylaria bambusicola]
MGRPILTGHNPFSDPDVAERYRQIYEQARYEGRHRFDPQLTWTLEEERRLVRRIDLRACLWVCIIFTVIHVDNGNITQAVSETLLQDLNMNTNDFNLANTLFWVGFIVSEFPSQLISKKFGPDRWTPILLTTWSILAISQAAIRTKTNLLVLRGLLGLLVGGFVPDAILWLSYFYTSKELPIRLSFFFSTLVWEKVIFTFTGIGILHLRGVAGWPGWRWLFLIQGFIPLTVSIASFFMMPPSIVQTKTWFRPNGWFTDREEIIAVNRILRDDPSKGDMNNRQAITPRRIWNALKDFDLWPIYVIGFFINVPQDPPNTYLVITLRSLGFDTYVTNLLIIPSSVGHILALISITWLSERYKECAVFAMMQSIWTLPPLIALRFWPGVVKDVWGTYTLVTVLLSYPSSHAIMVGWLSKNCNGVGARAMSVTIQNVIYLLSNVWANNIYVESDRPLYHRGNTILITLNVVTLVLIVFAKVYYILRNRHRDRVWASMTPEERSAYTHDSKDEGTRRLDFRFAH